MSIEKKQLWILEDDAGINSVYGEIFSDPYDVLFFTTIQEFQVALNTLAKPTLVISDLRLPDGDFVDFLKCSMDKIEGIPFLVVSANADIEVLNFCLKGGAVDYLTKPFQLNELLVKIDFFLKKHNKLTDNKLAKINNHFITNCLTYKESKILGMLMENVEEFVTRKAIFDDVWGTTENPNPKTMDVHLFNLRKKLVPLGLSIYSDNRSRLRLT